MIGRRQAVNIGRGCEDRGIVQHEILHALGRAHEQSRPDRDNYVIINMNNIRRGNNIFSHDNVKIPVLLLQNIDIISKYLERTLVCPMTMVQSCTMDHMILVLMVGQLSVLFDLQVLDKDEAYPQQIGGMYRELIVSVTMPEHKNKHFVIIIQY